MKRREFIKKSTVAASSIAISGIQQGTSVADELQRSSSSTNLARLPQRDYGMTGVKLSIIGFGGIVVKDAEQQHANRVVAEAEKLPRDILFKNFNYHTGTDCPASFTNSKT